MSAPVATVKQAAAEVVASSADALCNEDYTEAQGVYLMTKWTFGKLYGRPYNPRTDRREFERIKWHVRRALSGDGKGRGGAREGAGRTVKEQAG